MPEFVLDHGDSPEASERFRKLDSFTRGYITAMFFTECNADNEELEDATLSDLAPQTWQEIEESCRDFQQLAQADLNEAINNNRYDEDRAGNDFWYTRNGHGTGFWDRGFGDLRTDTLGGRLSRFAKSFGSADLYRGDDGLLYLS